MNSPYESGLTPHHNDAAPGTPPPPMPTWCRKCRQSIGATDAYCKHCGTRQNVTDPFYYHPLWILVLAFTVLGPFALGLVWRSRTMNPTTKGIVAAIILAYTAFTFYAGYALFAIIYREFSMLNQIM